jgi:cytochrome d ubiquinol oxidase subunit II
MTIDLPLVWALIIAFAVFAYVVLDGFDLGVGILFPFLRTTEQRNIAMNTVAPVWDGNETWLVLGGGGLLAVFPLAYAVILSALYAPLIAMLLALVLRGVAFEFRWRTERGKFLWDWAFTGGSLVAALAQGIMLGALLQGIAVSGRTYAGGWYDWLTPFSLLTSVSVAIGYALLGAAWLIMKTEGEVRDLAYRAANVLLFAMAAAILAVSAWTPFLEAQFMRRWLSFPSVIYAAPVPLLTAGVLFYLWSSLRAQRDRPPFWATLCLFLLCYIGLGISLYPQIVPPGITIWQAAAPTNSLEFLLIGAVVLIPIILAYTGYAYWVFRGKVEAGGGYH